MVYTAGSSLMGSFATQALSYAASGAVAITASSPFRYALVGSMMTQSVDEKLCKMIGPCSASATEMAKGNMWVAVPLSCAIGYMCNASPAMIAATAAMSVAIEYLPAAVGLPSDPLAKAAAATTSGLWELGKAGFESLIGQQSEKTEDKAIASEKTVTKEETEMMAMKKSIAATSRAVKQLARKENVMTEDLGVIEEDLADIKEDVLTLRNEVEKLQNLLREVLERQMQTETEPKRPLDSQSRQVGGGDTRTGVTRAGMVTRAAAARARHEASGLSATGPATYRLSLARR